MMLRQRQYVETLESGSSIEVWSVLRGRSSLWAATFLEGPRKRDGKVKIRWAGYSKSSFHWVPSSDVHVPDEDPNIPRSVSEHRFKDGTKEYLMRWGDESYTWETQANESIRQSGILDVYEMRMAAKVSKAAATVFAVLRHEFSPRTGLAKVDMTSIKFCAGLPASGLPPEDHENDYGLVRKGSTVSVWLPIAEEWLHCVVAECCGGRDQVAKRRRSSATESRRNVAPKPSAAVRKNPKKRSSSSVSCSDGPRALRPNPLIKRCDCCGNNKTSHGFPKAQMQTASRRGSRRDGRGEAQTNSCEKENERGGNNGRESPVHVPKNSIGDEEEAGGDGIPRHESRDELADAEAPSITELDELDPNEFYLGGAPLALQGLVNGLVTSYDIAQEFGY